MTVVDMVQMDVKTNKTGTSHLDYVISQVLRYSTTKAVLW
jgi:hypothetical protein